MESPPWLCDFPGCKKKTRLTIHTNSGRKKTWHFCSEHIVERTDVGDEEDKLRYEYESGIE